MAGGKDKDLMKTFKLISQDLIHQDVWESPGSHSDWLQRKEKSDTDLAASCKILKASPVTSYAC